MRQRDFFFFSSRRRHTRCSRDWSSDVCSSDLILSLDPQNQRAVVQPGVVNFDLSLAAAPHGLYFAPDPSSQKSCTIGGNVAENAGGPHTLAYGVTTNHVTALELVLPDGEVVRVGSAQGDAPGYDLTGILVGSEGTLALVTEITEIGRAHV